MLNNSFLSLLIYILATYRLAYLLVEDDGPFYWFARWRAWLIRNAEKGALYETAKELFHCTFCMGLWCAVVVAVLPAVVVVVLAVAGGQLILERWHRGE